MTFRNHAIEVSYALPTHASAEMRLFLQTHAIVHFERAFVAHLPNGRIFGSGDVLAPDGKSIARDVSPDFGKSFENHWLLTYKKIPSPVRLSGKTSVIATTLGAGYGHWLLDEIPRLLALENVDSETLIAHASNGYNREAIMLHGFSGKIVGARRNTHYSCDDLVAPSIGALTPAVVSALEEFSAPLRDTKTNFGDRLYISRAKAKRRRVSNEEALWAALASRGFEKLQLENLSWAEQIAAFRSAKVIVAPHGAGLANLVFCRPQTKIVELFNRSYVNGCFWQLAALKALDYCPVVLESAEPLAQIRSANRLDIAAEIGSVLNVLDE